MTHVTSDVTTVTTKKWQTINRFDVVCDCDCETTSKADRMGSPFFAGRAFVLKLTGQRISACNCTYQLRGSDITGLSCKQTVGQSQLGILGSWAIFSSRIERVLLGQ